MNDRSRIILFLTGCMTLRLSLAIIAKILDPKYLPIMGIMALAISIGFLYSFLLSKKSLGLFGGKVWWNDMRLVHAILYFIFFVCAIMKKTSSWLILLLDALIGLGAFIVHYL